MHIGQTLNLGDTLGHSEHENQWPCSLHSKPIVWFSLLLRKRVYFFLQGVVVTEAAIIIDAVIFIRSLCKMVTFSKMQIHSD